jgi:hypothetical protein
MKAAASNGFETVHVVRQHEPASPEGLRYAKKRQQDSKRAEGSVRKEEEDPRLFLEQFRRIFLLQDPEPKAL